MSAQLSTLARMGYRKVPQENPARDIEMISTETGRMTGRDESIVVRSEHLMPMGVVQVASYNLRETTDLFVPGGDVYRLDMAINPRPANARGHYIRHWTHDRFKRLGTIWMVPPDEPVRFRSEPGSTTCVHCSLRPEAVAEWLGSESGWRADLLEGTFDMPGSRIRALLGHLAEELQMPGFAHEAMLELICGQIAIEISRYWRSGVKDNRPQGLASWRLRAIEDRLAASAQLPTLAELAAICGISVRQLTRGFRVSRGRSIGDAITDRRIAQAQYLLTSDIGLKEIAHRLGFASHAGFTYAFRKATGETPGAFRVRLRGGGQIA